MKLRKFLFLAAAATLSAPALAQPVGTNPAVTYLMQTYGLAKDEAQMRIDLQNEIIALSERLNSGSEPDFGDMYIKQEPQFRIVVLFANSSDRKDFLDSLDPKLRRYVQLKTAKKSRGVFTRELTELSAALNALKLPFTAKYDLETEKYVVNVETEEAAARVRASLPETRKVETLVQVVPLPKVQSAPTGVVAGDALPGGSAVFVSQLPAGTTDATVRSSDLADCTLSYAVGYTIGGVAKRGILTAGHCPDTMVARIGGHYVTLSGPDVQRPNRDTDGLSDKYDFQIFDTTGITVDNRVGYFDENSIPEFPDSGELRLTAITSFLNQKAGMVVCKSGANSGITCGSITNGNLTWDGVPGWIEVSKTNQRVISVGGDSGAAWFLYPGSSTTITGVGVHTAGNAVPGTTGIAIYMPIDYIDDQNSTINTIKQ
ncbi:MAG: streptogrisin [Sphingomonadales bacterium]|jgi:hypothetical protein|nr:streptogrisin [Sphingomonadales bacterium]